jgi:hypothetical protein
VKPRCPNVMPRSGGRCGRPEGHGSHCLSVKAWEFMRERNLRRIAAAKLLDTYMATLTKEIR